MRFLNQLSIRVRITLGTLLLALAFFVVSALIVHALVDRLLSDSTVALLEADIAPFETAILNEPNDAVDAPGDGQLIAVIDPSGTEHVSTLPRSLHDELGSLEEMTEAPTQVAVGGSRYLILIERVSDTAGEWTIVAARDQSSADAVMSTLTTGLLVGFAVLVLAFGLASWLLTGSALRPVARLRRSAEAIVAAKSQELLPVGAAKDEIQDLAVTLNHLIEDLRAAAARERQMVSDASHELRTPLAVLQGQLELMRAGDRVHLEEDILSAEHAAGRLSHLVAELLELSRLESRAGASGTATPAELVVEAGDAVDRARLAAAGRSIDIELSVDATDGPGRAAIRAVTFGRIVDNLLGNAVAAVGDSGRIEVAVGIDESSVTLSVADDGPGMDEGFLPHAFDRFSRPDDARAGSGAGLGLAIVSAAVAAAGGTATLDNRDPDGLLATIRLPLGRDEAS